MCVHSDLVAKYVSAVLSTLFISFSTFGQTDVESLKVRTEYFKLPNGMRVVLMPDATATEVSLEFWIHTGTRDEEPGEYGFAHFFEHATPYGLLNDEAARTVFRAGLTNSNAQTRKDYIRYYLQMKPGNLDLALRYISERMQAEPSVITEKVIENHRKNVLNEMTRQETNALYGPLASMAREAATYGAMHPYGHGTYGTLADNQLFSAGQVRAWYAAHFHPTNILIFVAGKFEHTEVRSQVRSVLGRLPARENRDRTHRPRISPAGEESSVSTGVPESHLSIVWPTDRYGERSTLALHLVALILDARLNASKPTVISQARSSPLLNSWELAGQFGIYATFDSPDHRNLAETFLRDAVEELATKQVSPDELEQAKRIVMAETGEKRSKLGFTDSRTELVGEGVLFRNDPEAFIKQLRIQQSFSPKDLKRAVASLLKYKGAAVFVVPIR